MYEEKEKKPCHLSKNKGKVTSEKKMKSKIEGSPGTPFKLSTIGSTPHIEPSKLASKIVIFTYSKALITIKVRFEIKKFDTLGNLH